MRELIGCVPPKYYYSFEKSRGRVYYCLICNKGGAEGGYDVFHNGIRGNGIQMECSYSGSVCSEACMNLYKFKLLDYNVGLYK